VLRSGDHAAVSWTSGRESAENQSATIACVTPSLLVLHVPEFPLFALVPDDDTSSKQVSASAVCCVRPARLSRRVDFLALPAAEWLLDPKTLQPTDFLYRDAKMPSMTFSGGDHEAQAW
jgi:hypothetical protein